MLSDLTIALILTQREQQRLNTQAKRLSRYNLDDVQLTALRQRWLSGLGYRQYAPALLASLDHLIEQLQRGEYHLEDYDEVVFQISAYNHSSWALLRQTWGSPSRYLDRWGKIYPEYRYAFEQAYEANTKLSVTDQVAWLQQLLPTPTDMQTSPRKLSEVEKRLRQCQSYPEVEPEEDVLSFSDDDLLIPDNKPGKEEKPASNSKVVDLNAYRKRRRRE
ncbi:hypothetical protein VRRI112168_19660 [Vreelandella rituensis]|uniref:Uncharacterized protein n=1 Tax=Vreelandella rituensis TaxID=2282306 RepID=A0A368TN70_9GAMM|nr:hypothetical protein [Halomonas rituensis]RCV85746.1 hypothetical protein DU506_20545 [Halomonas rituensis]